MDIVVMIIFSVDVRVYTDRWEKNTLSGSISFAKLHSWRLQDPLAVRQEGSPGQNWGGQKSPRGSDPGEYLYVDNSHLVQQVSVRLVMTSHFFTPEIKSAL